MQSNTISSTALEKLKKQAKQIRDTKGISLTDALEAVAQQAGFQNWNQVVSTQKNYVPALMPASHRFRLHEVSGVGPRLVTCNSVEELCEWLGGVEPVLLRSHCHQSRPGARCLCELDPFVTAMRANVHIDIGDKYDTWHYLYMREKPYSGVDIVSVRVNLGLGSHGDYINERFFSRSNSDRGNSLNPNNDSYHASRGNRANQLNPNNWRFSE